MYNIVSIKPRNRRIVARRIDDDFVHAKSVDSRMEKISTVIGLRQFVERWELVFDDARLPRPIGRIATLDFCRRMALIPRAKRAIRIVHGQTRAHDRLRKLDRTLRTLRRDDDPFSRQNVISKLGHLLLLRLFLLRHHRKKSPNHRLS